MRVFYTDKLKDHLALEWKGGRRISCRFRSLRWLASRSSICQSVSPG